MIEEEYQNETGAFYIIYDLRQQELARQDKLVGRVTYASGECQEFTDPEEYQNETGAFYIAARFP